jgi:kynurenine formamidase
MTEHPYLSAEACHALLRAGVRTIGIDEMNIDQAPGEANPGEGFVCHHRSASSRGANGSWALRPSLVRS